MLEVLRRQDLEGVLATVVRYFGGVKLGAGGLVRAYTDAVAQALLGAEKVRLQRMVALACSVPYALEVRCGGGSNTPGLRWAGARMARGGGGRFGATGGGGGGCAGALKKPG